MIDGSPAGVDVASVPAGGAASAPRPSGLRRVVALPAWGHVALLALVVAAFVAASNPGTGFSSDEGAAVSQARILRDDGTWYYRYPLAWMQDATGARPFIRADVGSRGIAPYAKHPTYP